jgi:16S rRNA (uracil1498-N3)-methyltransferase
MPGSAPLRRFFLSRSPLDAQREGRGRPELSRAEAEHAVRVVRLRAGDRFIGLDGRGHAWTIAIVGVEAGTPVLECVDDARSEPRAGDAGAALPWIEIALVLPRATRAEDVIDGLTQLGAAAISRLTSERAHPAAREASAAREERVVRAAIEACKQSARAWLPSLPPVRPLAQWIASAGTGDLASAATGNVASASAGNVASASAGNVASAGAGNVASAGTGNTVWLAPRATTDLSEWLDRAIDRRRAAWSESSPLRLLVGPEGGFTEAEESSLRAAGAVAACLGPHTLRVETAACAALAIAAERAFRARRS